MKILMMQINVICQSNFFLQAKYYFYLLYDVAVIQWITSCHKNRMTTRVITLWRVRFMSLTPSVSTVRFHMELLFILKTIKFRCKGSYDKQSLAFVVISYEIYETRTSSFHTFHMK